MRAEGDTDRLARPGAERDPKVIDVGRYAIDFSGEGDRRAGDMNQIAVAEIRIGVPPWMSMSMRQSLREIWRRPALRPLVILSDPRERKR